MAVEWKKNMEDTVKDSLVVLGFLHLLAAYKLASAFDSNELASLLDIVANHRQTPKLRRSLGFADEVPVTHHGIATSASREQLQIQNPYKRPRTETYLLLL